MGLVSLKREQEMRIARFLADNGDSPVSLAFRQVVKDAVKEAVEEAILEMIPGRIIFRRWKNAAKQLANKLKARCFYEK